METRPPVVAVIGAGGQLGHALSAQWADRAEVHRFTHDRLDLCDAAAVASMVADVRPSVVVNAAAFNDVDGAESRQVDALDINGIGVGVLARAAASVGATFVHYSTDFVFAGTVPGVWTEADPPEPQSVYAQSKLMGEWLAAECPSHYVLRVESLFGGERRRSSIDRIVDTLLRGEPVTLFADRTVTPSFVDDVAEATWRLLETQGPPGLYHCVNAGVTTWYGVGMAVARACGADEALLRPTSVRHVAMKAPRPQYAALSAARLQAVAGALPEWRDAVTRYLRRRGVAGADARE
jgi:dTDP-4-dehydrorhamnose reductase